MISDHGICLPSTRGSIGKNSGIVAIQDSYDERMGGFEIDLPREVVTF